ncbi:MAG: cytochrome b [Gammaproteobacteria bacterium]|jgi:ubiquinol-cytochrome c reductase cytochrome b subunit|nr:cytochrome b [Gammaproteobacteria bacterium]
MKTLLEIILGPRHFVPKNLNFWYVFGALLLFAFVIQFISGLWLAMFYQPSATQAFASIQYLMREVPYGWLIHSLHAAGASAIFILLYLHMIRGLIYRSYRTPRELVWFFGVILFWLVMAESFLGYLLPWGQMSYWGATVVTNLLTVLPHGDDFATWLRGDYQVSGVTLTRFYALHVIALPVMLIFVMQWHIKALHYVGSGNPQLLPIDTRSVDGKVPKDCMAFFPYQALKDLLAIIIFLILFCAVVFFVPHLFQDPINLIPADSMQTPQEIKPLWYLASFYSLLRAVPSKLGGILFLMLSMLMWLLMPWLDRLTKARVHLLHKCLVGAWVFSWGLLTYFGLQPVAAWMNQVLLICSISYFVLFILMGIL